MSETTVAFFGRPLAALAFIATIAVGGALVGCGDAKAVTASASAPPTVTVAAALERQVFDFDEFTGRFEATERVEIRPRVSGYVTAVRFAEGSDVRKGELLYEIDARPYLAQRDHARAELAQARSQRELARAELERATQMLAQRAIAREEYDSRLASDQQAQANLEAAAAALAAAQLDVDFTHVTAPIAGRISKTQITAGNLVTADQTLLTTLVALDPIYVGFESDERAYLRYAKLHRSESTPAHARAAVWVGLADEAGYPHQGELVFVDNGLDPGTGTIHARALLGNADRLYSPGLFARLKLQGGNAHQAVLVNDSAIGTDQTVRFVFVVGGDGKVQYRLVTLGPTNEGLREITAGLTAGEQVIVNGLQRVRPGATVAVTRVAMGERTHGADLNHGDESLLAGPVAARSQRSVR